MQVRDFDFDLPSELIAQEPSARRADARLLHLARSSGAITHSVVSSLPSFLERGDLLVVNNTRVFPARLLGRRVPSGGAVECLLVAPALTPLEAGSDPGLTPLEAASDPGLTSLEAPSDPASSPLRAAFDRGQSQVWDALMHPGQKLKPGSRVIFEGKCTLHGEVLERHFYGRRRIRLWTTDGTPVDAAVDAIGHVPLPPYIKRADLSSDRDRYQTVYARERGSVAAPTAGLHFDAPLLDALRQRGVGIAAITLHVGYGTFQPVRVEEVEQHRLDAERYEVSDEAAAAINSALEEGRRVIAVGTTTTRTLEAVARQHDGRIAAGPGTTDLFIFPGFEFRVIRGLITNFHLPQSSLLMLVAAFAGRQQVLNAYRTAISERYRFYSYGDAMVIV